MSDGDYLSGEEYGRKKATEELMKEMTKVLDKAQALVDMIEDAENNHGGLIGKKTLRCKNELRLELERWSK